MFEEDETEETTYYFCSLCNWNGEASFSDPEGHGDYESILQRAKNYGGLVAVFHDDGFGYNRVVTDVFYEGVRFSKVGE